MSWDQKLRLPTQPGQTPGHAVERDGGVPFLRLAHDPPFIAAEVVLVVSGMHVAGLGALRRAVAGHLDEEGLQRSAEFGLEEHVQHLAPLRFGIVLQQDRGGPAAAHRADAVEALAAGVALEFHGLVGKGREAESRHGTTQ